MTSRYSDLESVININICIAIGIIVVIIILRNPHRNVATHGFEIAYLKYRVRNVCLRTAANTAIYSTVSRVIGFRVKFCHAYSLAVN